MCDHSSATTAQIIHPQAQAPLPTYAEIIGRNRIALLAGGHNHLAQALTHVLPTSKTSAKPSAKPSQTRRFLRVLHIPRRFIPEQNYDGCRSMSIQTLWKANEAQVIAICA